MNNYKQQYNIIIPKLANKVFNFEEKMGIAVSTQESYIENLQETWIRMRIQ